MGATAAEKADNTGPLEKRMVSKNWSVRANAYEELTKMCLDSERNSKADFFRAHACEFKVYLKDVNPGALEKCLTCLNAFLDKVHKTIISEAQNDIISMLVEKCLGHAKPVIKDKSKECLRVIFEVSENFEDCVETLQGLASHKNIKVSKLLLKTHFSLFRCLPVEHWLWPTSWRTSVTRKSEFQITQSRC